MLRERVAGWRQAGERVALVPTMGALHAGHVRLVERAAAEADRIVVSIFVNPAQFAPNEDFGRYPRTFGTDLAALSDTRTDAVYAPAVGDMYPEGFATRIAVAGPAEGLESASRPHFFGGVATVVAKLFIQCAPDVAIFGEKDFQQLAVVTRMARDLDLGVRIVGEPTMREADGLALSSRNAYLTPAERRTAPELHAAISDVAAAVRSGGDIGDATRQAAARLAAAGFVVDYVEVRDAETLGAADPSSRRPLRVLAAARLGATRLIDNVAVAP